MGNSKRSWIVRLAAGLAALSAVFGAAGAHAQTFTWEVTVASGADRRWNTEDAIPVVVATGPVDSRGLRLSQSELVDRETGTRLRLRLCDNETDPCRLDPNLPARQVRTLFLRLRDIPFQRVGPGNYTGNIVVAAEQDPDGKAAAMSLYVSGVLYQWGGVLAIALGVLLAWLLTVWIRSRIARLELRKLLALLARREASLKAKLEAAFGGAAPDKAPRSFAILGRIAEDRAEADGLLPPALPTPWQGTWAGQVRFETLVNAIDGRLDGLSVIVDDGLVPASKIGTPGGDEAVAKIDELADKAGVTALPELTAQVLALLDNARHALKNVTGPAAAGSPAPDKYSVEVVLLGAVSWGVILIGTILVGTAALILPDKDFGRIGDYVVCLLWGLGVPAAGGQLTSPSVDSVRTALKITP